MRGRFSGHRQPTAFAALMAFLVVLGGSTRAQAYGSCTISNPAPSPTTTSYACACPATGCGSNPSAWLPPGLTVSNCWVGWPAMMQGLKQQHNNTTLVLSPGTFTRSGNYNYVGMTIGTVPTGVFRSSDVVVGATTNLRIVGQGPSTEIRMDGTDQAVSFEIGENVSGLEISNLTIRATTQAGYKKEAVSVALASGDAALLSVDGVRLADLTISGTHVGILIGGGTVPITNVSIIGNHIQDIHGFESGYGYGIANGNVRCSRISQNEVLRAGRHSIYESWARDCAGIDACVLIDNNTLTDNGDVGGQINPNYNAAALAVARSDNVTVAHNRVIGSHMHGASAEKDDPSLNSTNIHFIGNTFILTRRTESRPVSDIWVNIESGTNAYLWHNRKEGNADAVVTVSGGTAVDMAGAGTFWQGTQALTEMNGSVYVVQGNYLHRVVPEYGRDARMYWRSYVYSTTVWGGFQALATDDGHGYVMAANTLYRVTPSTSTNQWAYTYSPTNWSGFEALTAGRHDSRLYVVQSGYLHKVNPNNWSYNYSTTNFAGTSAMSGYPGHLYILQNGSYLHDVVPQDSNTWWSYSVIQ